MGGAEGIDMKTPYAKVYVFKGKNTPECVIEMSKEQYEQVRKLPGENINDQLRYLYYHRYRLTIPE